MRLEDECKLSCYQELAVLSAEHHVCLVQDQRNKKIFVKKVLNTFNYEVYRYLQENPVANIPHIYEVIVDADQLIVIEEYISGDTLQERIGECGILSENEAVAIMDQLCKILKDLHQAHPPIIHRDVKPSNIIISPDGVVKLIDLNAAKLGNSRVGMDTKLMGTAGYAAPEQYGFAVSNIKTDIYALGVLMNVMLTGVPPVERLAREPFGHIISRCTRMDQQERYDNVEAVQHELHACVYQRSHDGIQYKWRNAPPGFRSGNIPSMFFPMLGYLCIIWLGMTATVDTTDLRILWINRIAITVSLVAIVFFWGDFMGIKEKMGINQVNNGIWRFLSNVLFSISILIIGVILAAFAESILF